MRVVIVATFVLAGARSAGADQLKLSDVVTTAVHQAPELAHAKLSVVAAQATSLVAQGIEDVHIGASATYDTSNQTVVDNNIVIDPQTIAGLDISVSKMFSTGGTVSVSAGAIRSKVGDLRSYETSATLAINQPLLRGAGAGTAEAGIRAAAGAETAAQLVAEGRARDLVVSLAQAYWAVALAREELEVRKHSFDFVKKQQEFTEGQIRADKVAKSELLAVQQALASRQQDVIAAEQALLERSLELRQLAGLEIAADAVSTEPLPAIPAGDIDLPKTLALVNERSVVLAGMVATERADAASLEGAEGNARSRLDLSVAAGPVATRDGFGDAVKNTASFSGYAVTGSLVFDHAIQRHAERGNIAAARTALEQAKVDTRAARLALSVRATRAVQRARAAAQSAALGERSIDLAQQNIEAEQHRFELGKSTNFDVLLRQDALEQAKLRQAQFLVDYLNARADLDGLTGDILTKYGVTMP